MQGIGCLLCPGCLRVDTWCPCGDLALGLGPRRKGRLLQTQGAQLLQSLRVLAQCGQPEPLRVSPLLDLGASGSWVCILGQVWSTGERTAWAPQHGWIHICLGGGGPGLGSQSGGGRFREPSQGEQHRTCCQPEEFSCRSRARAALSIVAWHSDRGPPAQPFLRPPVGPQRLGTVNAPTQGSCVLCFPLGMFRGEGLEGGSVPSPTALPTKALSTLFLFLGLSQWL